MANQGKFYDSKCPNCGTPGAPLRFMCAWAVTLFCASCDVEWNVKPDRLIGEAGEAFRASVAKSKPDEPPPRVMGKVIGYRAWKLHGYQLRSLNQSVSGHPTPVSWKLGANKAKCLSAAVRLTPPLGTHDAPAHDAPAHGCGCGLYAYFDVDRASAERWQEGVVVGAVTAWGRLEVHRNGFRAEYAEPIALAYHPRDAYEDVLNLEAVAGEMGLPFVAVSELEREAAKHGRPVPVEMQPVGSGAADDFVGWVNTTGAVYLSSENTVTLTSPVGPTRVLRNDNETSGGLEWTQGRRANG